jgi:hypothetical protein
MAIKYTYTGLEGNWHIWNRFYKGETTEYARHIQDEAQRQPVIDKFRELGFTDKMIALIIGTEMMYGPEDFSLRDQD